MGNGEQISITRRVISRLGDLSSGVEYRIQVKTRFQGHMLEVEDAHFHLNSAVMLPDYGEPTPPDDQAADSNRITGIAVLVACYRHARGHQSQQALVVGHTDRSGPTDYNQRLSELRAKNVLFALNGDRAGWVEIALQKHKVEDYQQILRWLTISLGWNCDPGPKDNVLGSQTRRGTKAFQEQYNDRFSASIGEDGVVGRQTWGAFFDVYMQELRYALGTDETGLAEARSHLHYLTCESIGCGENFPITPDRASNYQSQIDRRVEILFFDPGEEPIVDCRRPGGACTDLYERSMYQLDPIELEPMPVPSGLAVHVIAQLAFKDPDPDNPDHHLPEGFPVTIAYLDGSTENLQLGSDGILNFFPLREKQAFTIQFQFSDEHYIASPPASGADDELIGSSDVDDRVGNDFRVFLLPGSWSLETSIWQVTGATIYNEATRQFEGLDDMSITNVGSSATPVGMQLDPRWQYLRFEFFDRVYGHDHHGHERIGIPPLMLKGFLQMPASGTTVPADTRSNWQFHFDDPETVCQCLPWIIQSDGLTSVPKPDNQVLIQFQTEPKTFIVSDSATSRRLEVNTDPTILQPGPDRLKYYDLPELWRSQHYHARPTSGHGCAYEALTAVQIEESTQSDKPLTFSLDDMVLTDETLAPLAWVPTDRAALFSHKFGVDGHTVLANSGLYNADTTNKESFLTKEQVVEKTRNYVTDYPNWTRLIIAQGNLCDVFDLRTPNVDGQVVGARAAVRWVDALQRISPLKVFRFDASGTAQEVTGANVVVHPGRFYHPTKPDPITPRTPAGDDHHFFVIQPFFEQQYIRVTTSLSTGSYDFKTTPDIPGGNRARVSGIGRFDLAMLRCCDTDGSIEKAVSLQYFKFNFDFSGAPASLNTPAAQKAHIDEAVANIPIRWNGPDAFNPGPPVVEKQGADANLHIKVLWFTQSLDHNQAHYKLDVVSDAGRSFMNSQKGTGELRIGAIKVGDSPAKNKPPGTLVVAHECGHGGSLPDEYSETTTKCSYHQPPVRSNNIPSDFYDLDARGMMNSNREIRGRYSWHVAEWVRRLLGGNYKIRHDSHEFEVPQHPNNSTASPGPARNFVNWPLKAEVNTRTGAMHADAAVDVLFYALGADKFSAQLIKAGTLFHGIVVVILKMRFSIPPNPTFATSGTFGRIRSDLNTINSRLDTRFNNRWRVTGSTGGVTFNNCLVHFAFRYLVTTITNEANARNQRYLNGNGGSIAGYNTLATSLENDHDVHLEVNVIDPPSAQTTALSGKTLRLRSTDYNRIDQFVAQFLGLSTAAPATGGPFPDKGQILPLVQKVITANAGDIHTL